MAKEHKEHGDHDELVRFQTYFKEDTLEKLRVLAFERSTVRDRVTMNDLVRQAVNHWLELSEQKRDLAKVKR